MDEQKMKRLDEVSNRIGALYQRFGQLQHKHSIDDPDVAFIMDELVDLTYVVEDISDRKKRELGN